MTTIPSTPYNPTMTEHWQYIPGYPNYAASTHGRIFSFHVNRVMKPRIERKGTRPSARYLLVELFKDGKFKRFHVHRLILLAFRGPPKPGQQCRHLDSDRLNNRLSNLVWGTYEENREDWKKLGRGRVLTDDQIRYIRASTATYRAIAAELGCSKSLVGYVKNDEIWKDPALYP